MPDSASVYSSESNGEIGLLSFVIHLWKEEPASEDHPVLWRGHITPVPDGQRHYFTSLSEIPNLIVAHLKLQE